MVFHKYLTACFEDPEVRENKNLYESEILWYFDVCRESLREYGGNIV
jgi:hypothetical protein